MRLLTNADDIPAFLAAKPAAAVHFDADWDVGYRQRVRQSMVEAEAALGTQVNFAEVNCDAPVIYLKSVPIGNVPTVAYYREGKLVGALVGADQNVRARLERMLRGEKIDYKDGTNDYLKYGQPPQEVSGFVTIGLGIVVFILHCLIQFFLYRGRVENAWSIADSDVVVFLLPLLLALVGYAVLSGRWAAGTDWSVGGKVAATIALTLIATFLSYFGSMVISINLYGG
jgi:hypothetical protein